MQPGSVLFHRDFEFPDGGSANKYLIVLGAADGSHVVVA
jgi:hypothetical protein